MASNESALQAKSYPHSLRRIDHLVLAARDLDALAGFFRRLGFIVGARNRHPWGTQNHIVQFDGAFIELIGVDPGFHLAPDHDPHNFSFSGFIGGFLKEREGGAMIALTSDNAEADARAFKVTGIGDFEPFHFERRGRKPDGSSIAVGFTLAFARSPLMPDIGCFACQHHFPENFWDPAFRAHANGAAVLEALVIAAENPADHGEFLSHLTGLREYSASSRGIVFELGDAPAQRISVLTPQALRQEFGAAALPADPVRPVIAGCLIAVADGAALAATLEGGDIPFERVGETMVIGPQSAFGLALAFRPLR